MGYDPPDGDGPDNQNGVLEIGGTLTICAGIGFSVEFGKATDGGDWIWYFSADLAFGVDASVGVTVDYLSSPYNNSVSFSDAKGWGETYNYSVLYGDYNYGGGSFYPGLDFNSYSDTFVNYSSMGGGITYSPFPFSFTRNKGYTWYFY